MLMYSSGRFPTELTGHGSPRRVDCKKSLSAHETNKNNGDVIRFRKNYQRQKLSTTISGAISA